MTPDTPGGAPCSDASGVDTTRLDPCPDHGRAFIVTAIPDRYLLGQCKPCFEEAAAGRRQRVWIHSTDTLNGAWAPWIDGSGKTVDELVATLP